MSNEILFVECLTIDAVLLNYNLCLFDWLLCLVVNLDGFLRSSNLHFTCLLVVREKRETCNTPRLAKEVKFLLLFLYLFLVYALCVIPLLFEKFHTSKLFLVKDTLSFDIRVRQRE